MSDVIKTQVKLTTQQLRKMYPEIPIREDTDVFLVTTADGMLIEFDTIEDGGLFGKAILSVSLYENEDGTLSIVRGKAA